MATQEDTSIHSQRIWTTFTRNLNRRPPEKNLDALVSELFTFKPLTQESAELMARFHTRKSEVAEHLADVRAAKIERSNNVKRSAMKRSSWNVMRRRSWLNLNRKHLSYFKLIPPWTARQRIQVNAYRIRAPNTKILTWRC